MQDWNFRREICTISKLNEVINDGNEMSILQFRNGKR